jgi:hypothetical protein
MNERIHESSFGNIVFLSYNQVENLARNSMARAM